MQPGCSVSYKDRHLVYNSHPKHIKEAAGVSTAASKQGSQGARIDANSALVLHKARTVSICEHRSFAKAMLSDISGLLYVL